LDTHRAWEALYLHGYPVVIKDKWTRVFKDLPVVEVNSWEECTKELLEDKYIEFNKTQWSWEKLSMNYWEQEIREEQWQLL
jgi:hypothetical protein